MSRERRNISYFDFLFERMKQGDREWTTAFGHHVHWGYWPEPHRTAPSVEDFAVAAENLSRRVCDATQPADGMRILDVGCGLGGTLASLNERFSNLSLVGVNIDLPQLRRAREQIQAKAQNQLTLITADACRLPFKSGSFDAVLAIECIFHFPSRFKFLQEVHRVLRPGKMLALSDFVPRATTLPLLMLLFAFLHRSFSRVYGKLHGFCTLARYRSLARRAGFASFQHDDITANTLPTYGMLRRLYLGSGGLGRRGYKGTRFIEWSSRAGWLRYLILTLARGDEP